MHPATLSLREHPDWRSAAQLLIDGCAHLPDADSRVELLERLCAALGDDLYPALLSVLCMVGEQGTDEARAAVGCALVDGLRSGRVPSGGRPAWGASGARAGTQALRRLGPIEYLCAWYAQPTDTAAPSATSFDRALRSLLGLVASHDEARALYCQRLKAVAEDPLGGTLARATRDALARLADAWTGPRAQQQAVDAFMNAVGRSSAPSTAWAGAWSAAQAR